jgi:hypothetical protein
MTTIVPITAEVENVTPEMAASWLEFNTRNRSVAKLHVTVLAEEMQRGAWHLSGEAIKFAPDGTLLDGQHRLHAIIASGMTVPMLVVRGVEHDAQATLDTGRKRGAGDALSINGIAHANLVAAAARVLLGYPFAHAGIANYRVALAKVIEFADAHPGLVDSAAFAHSVTFVRGWTPKSLLAACHYVVAPTHREAYEAFIETVMSGVGVKDNSPELALIRFNQSVSSSRSRAASTGTHYVALARAFNASLAGATRAHIKINADSMPLIAGVSEVPTW